ncbi:hypothetical protein K493DRAFT_297132 [Basidiobolus meristosporus CBS 931.73]|uniref:Peptidase C51 domain-containing protein n=1 Tax=Basidiobolus meristosporus CBS 931.73 TaxID=1314790 RepID=A0A1Y1Z1L4_9FUNG|nr:hypothetical protein K493DRAFT_297132 [Basidiobolus meristosporus CBS 931.73]|eukprot:ORY04181.1 hypothetical protein K493DRAFT_297132 [Basidiobolus meristosporus CBS 931.73]
MPFLRNTTLFVLVLLVGFVNPLPIRDNANLKAREYSLEFRFGNGQCTDWADARYYQLTGYHTEWAGNAESWANNARRHSGWEVSREPRVPSIIVLPSFTQGTGSQGHVAVVEKINDDGTVSTSNFNFNKGPHVKTYADFNINGAQFIYHD